MKKFRVTLLVICMIVSLSTQSTSAWSRTENSGYAREVMWVYSCSGNDKWKCIKKGTIKSSVSTNNTNRWIRSSVMVNGKTIRSKASGKSYKDKNGIVWNANSASAQSAISVGKSNSNYHEYKRR